MMIIKNEQKGRLESRSVPRSEGCHGADIGFILASAILALFLVIPGAMAEENELECHYSGQTYSFNTTPCRGDWIYEWTATFVDTGLDAGEFIEGHIPDTCSVNWTAPLVNEETLVNLTVLVTNVYEDDQFDPISCIAMDNITVLVCPLANITVRKFYDVNGNGNWDPAEPPLNNWNMTLYNSSDCTGDPIAWTLTLEDGHCNFTGLLPGEYSVKETLKPGWEVTYPDTVCQNLTIASGENAEIYFGNRGNLSISGVKFYDPQATGVVAGKDRLGGWNITLSKLNQTSGEYEKLNTTTTSSNAGTLGQYSFDYLIPGIYKVCEELQDGWEQTYPDPGTDDGCHIVYLTCDPVSKTDADFGNRGDLNVTICKFHDLDGDGVKGDDEPTIPFWPVNLTGPYDYSFDGATGESGCIGFRYLPPGEYTASEGSVAGWVNTTPSSETFNLDPTNSPYNVSFGNRGDLSISGVKFYDPNNTGEVAGKNRLGGWNITLSLWNETAGEYEELNTTTTSSDAGTLGQYSFDYLIPGLYRVCETLKPGWQQTWPDTADGCHEVDLTGENPVSNPDADFGNRGDLEIDPCKFNDLNGNGTWDGDEPGIPGWAMTLTGGPDELEETRQTEEGGCVIFENLIPGEYTVTEETRDGWINTTPTSQTITLVSEISPQTVEFGNRRPTEFEVRKIALNKTVKRCEEITYLIQIKPDFENLILENVTVKDVFNKQVEFVSASPMPDADGIWRFAKVDVDSLPEDENDPDWKTLIKLVVRVPDKQDFEYDMAQGVAGEGFVNVKNDYSTTYQSYVITNCVELTTDTKLGKVFKDCESVTVMIDPGTELYTREHGSGTYESDELVSVRTENKSISMDKDMAATYSPTTLGLYRGRTVDYSSRWTEEANAKNRVTGTSMSEQYRYATFIDRESRMFLDENESVMNIDSEFDGMGHIGFLKMPSNTSTAHDTPTIEVREDYVGSFKILQKVDEYGSSVSYEKAATGSGFTVGDRRIKDSQRSYESGTGEYDSEEIIETATNYIAKDISLVSGPMNQSLTEDVSISASQKWKEGMYSRNPRVSYIGEEFTSLDYLDKETIAKGLNEMNTQASFEGRARFRALLEPNKGEPEVDFDEQYEGDYSIERHVLFTGVPKYDRPHLNVTKTLDSLVEVDDPCEENESECTDTRTEATYTITIENDGDVALQPVYVTDYFPPGAIFLQPSSLRPEELTDKYVNWTLTHMNIGDVVTITLSLDVTNYHPDELVNRVDVCGVYDNETVCARNFSAEEIDWLTCCLSDEAVSVKKSAEIDPMDQNVVRYRIEIANNENVTRVATVTDWLPDGMELIDSSIDFASYDGDVIVWNLLEIDPFETKTIEFSALAPGDGRFTNTVEVDPRSVDGPVAQPVRTSCVIDVGEVEDECGPVSCGVWQPPNWELEHYGYEPDELTCEDLTCTDCDGTDSCLTP